MEYTILTFNTNNQDISEHVHVLLNNIETDTVFIFLQEVYSPMSNIEKIKKSIKKALPSHQLIISERIFGIVSFLLTKTNEKKINTLRIGLGPFYLPNKGFIAIKYNNIIFINCHLKPHENNNHQRLQMIQSIFNSIKTFFKDFDGVVLSGDVNFRIKRNEETEKLLKDKNFKALKNYDEGQDFLKLYNFKEDEVRFNPTYKFINNNYSAKRFPSWCDRVFHNFEEIEIKEYVSLDISISDHMPVICKFKIIDNTINNNFPITTKEKNIQTKIILTDFYSKMYSNFYLSIAVGFLVIFFCLIWKIKKNEIHKK